jgi:hypothetical protein
LREFPFGIDSMMEKRCEPIAESRNRSPSRKITSQSCGKRDLICDQNAATPDKNENAMRFNSMTSTRFRTSISLAALAIAVPTAALAQDADGQKDIVVTGSRVVGRSQLDSTAPVDVFTGASLQQQGTPQLATAIANIAPSIDFPRPSNTDATDAIRPATLRGMSPDQTLVLINGERAHASVSTPFPPSRSTGWKCCATAPRPSMVPMPSPASST